MVVEGDQVVIRGLEGWVDSWQKEFNTSKCHVRHLGRGSKEYKYTMGGVEQTYMEGEKDVGVMMQAGQLQRCWLQGRAHLPPAVPCVRETSPKNAVVSWMYVIVILYL